MKPLPYILILISVLCTGACSKKYEILPIPATVNRTATPAATLPAQATPTVTQTATPTTVSAPLSIISVLIGGAGAYAGPSSPSVELSVNSAPETTAAVTFTCPVEGAIPLSFYGNSSMGSGMGAVFAAPGFGTCTYVPGGVYIISVSTSVGTAFCTMTAPGDIRFSSDGSSVTCLYPGDDNQATVQEGAPTFSITYSTATATSEPATLVFPPSAYPTGTSPVTFASTYIASKTVTTFTGTAVTGGYFMIYQEDMEGFTR